MVVDGAHARRRGAGALGLERLTDAHDEQPGEDEAPRIGDEGGVTTEGHGECSTERRAHCEHGPPG